jgi:hypothetical protein
MRAWLSVFLALSACSSGSSPAANGGDAGPSSDAAKDVHEGGSCFPTCPGDGGGTGSDAGNDGGLLTCAAMKANIGILQAKAQACNPQLPQQCNAATMGICCEITVTQGNTQAVNDFDQAVKDYKSRPCDTSFCSGALCPNVPSDVCSGSGTSGTCQ